jgi:hypothetical protein
MSKYLFKKKTTTSRLKNKPFSLLFINYCLKRLVAIFLSKYIFLGMNIHIHTHTKKYMHMCIKCMHAIFYFLLIQEKKTKKKLIIFALFFQMVYDKQSISLRN